LIVIRCSSHTTGSFSLNEVCSTIGTHAQYDRIDAQKI
jgi:hypothetical protein